MKKTLKNGMRVTAKDIYGEVCTGAIEVFGERIVILAEEDRYVVVNKAELSAQGYNFPAYKQEQLIEFLNNLKVEIA